jgi:hypothetical protein
MAVQATTEDERTAPYPCREMFLVFFARCTDRIQTLPRRRGRYRPSHNLTHLQEMVQVWPAR